MTDEERRQQAKRCEEQGHDWENCCSVLFRIYQRCKYCGAER